MTLIPPRKSNEREQTIAIIKPQTEFYTWQKQDFFENLLQEKSQLVRCNISEKLIKIFSPEETEEHYAHLRPMWFFPKIVDYMTSGESRILLLEWENAIHHGDRIKKEIRKQFGCHPWAFDWMYNNKPYKNIIHASDSRDEAKTEVQRYFWNSVSNILEI